MADLFETTTRDQRRETEAIEGLEMYIGWTNAQYHLLPAIRRGEIPHVTFEDVDTSVEKIALIDEIGRRMLAAAEKAKRHHAAFNPAEILTQMKLELEVKI